MTLSNIPRRLGLPLIAPEEKEPRAWHGWAAVTSLAETGADAPEPFDPQGDYGTALPDVPLTAPDDPAPGRHAELLAPAGGLEAGFAAFHFGADAIYLGLKKFSARAEAENFTLEEVDEITAYAHSLQPRRRVFVTINTLTREDELSELLEAVAGLDAIGVDALIIQDLGVYHLVRRWFPDLELHASTQLSVHNGAGAEALARLGFRRVVLARELTFEEVRQITATAGIETEVFIHGALCYSYSGLCLFSSQTLGRSGNRGKCAYSCRDSYEVANAPRTLRDGSAVRRDPRQGFPFSMKDLALPDHVPALRAAGVSCFKIEGRKKSPLYVATTTDYYRRLIDGRLSADDRPVLEADMQTVFSRPWTSLFLQSHRNKEVADRDTVGHRGTRIGSVEEVIVGRSGSRLRFFTARALQRHDGLQVDLPVLGKPFGFAVDQLWTVSSKRRGVRHEVFEAPTGSMVEVTLPADHPDLPPGAPVYCSSAQDVKQRYRHERPKPGAYRVRRRVDFDVVLTTDALTVTACVRPSRAAEATIEVTQTLAGPFAPAREPASTETAMREAFGRLGQTPLEMNSFGLQNDDHCFVPVSSLNRLRRSMTDAIVDACHSAALTRTRSIEKEIAGTLVNPPRTDAFRWAIKADRISHLDHFENTDFDDVEEVVVDITRDPLAVLQNRLSDLASHLGAHRLRLALPALTRRWEEKGLRQKIERLRADGWCRWEAANLSAWSFLDLDPTCASAGDIDLSTDWSVYVLNRLAARQLISMGVRRFTLSPEDGLDNVRSLVAEFGARATLIVYQDTPLFLAESCAYANLIGGCPGKANCRFESMEMVSSHGERVTALDYHCRTIVLNQGPFCLSTRLLDLAWIGAVSLRADFVYRAYEPEEVRQRWRLVRAGRAVPGGHSANFDRGVL